MPKIPEFGNATMSGVRPNIANNGTAGISAELSEIADILVDKKREDDQLQYQRALLDIQDFSNTELNDPDIGFNNLRGENALTGANKYNQRYVDKVGEVRNTLKGNTFLKDFDLQTQKMHTVYSRELMAHQSQQQSALSLKTMQSGIELAVMSAESLYNDQMSLDIGYQSIVSRVDQFSAEQGMPEVLRKTQVEGIKQTYFSSALNGWIANTELTGGDFSELGKEIKKSFAFNQLSEINQAKYLLNIDGRIKRQSNQYKDNLNLDLTNAWQMQIRGIEAPNIPLDRFKSVYGDDGEREYDEYQDKQVMAHNIQAMQGSPSGELAKYLQESITEKQGGNEDPLGADTKDEKFSTRLKLQNVRKQAALAVLNLRKQDPIAAAYQAGEVEQLDTSNLQDSLTRRVAQVERISKDYQTPLRIFSNSEASYVSQMLDNLEATEQSQLLKQFIGITGRNDVVFQAILDEIGKTNPTFSIAGTILNSGNVSVMTVDNFFLFDDETADAQSIANIMLKGASALKGTDKIKGVSVPREAKEEFDKLTQEIFTDDDISRGALYDAAVAYYTGKVVTSGDYRDTHELQYDLMKEAVNAVVGGKNKQYNTRMPWGMDDDFFSRNVEIQLTDIATKNGWLDSNSKKFVHNKHMLEPVTNNAGMPTGVYYVKAGNGFLRDNQGNIVVIDVLSGIRDRKETP